MGDPRGDRSPAARGEAGRGGDALRRTVFSLSEEETFDLGRSLARQLRGGELVLLEGDLGMGKTAFTRGIAAGLGVAPEDVSSPSYTLIQTYSGGRIPLVHVDLYRVITTEDLGTLGLEDILATGGVVVVEWGDRLPDFYRHDATTIRFHEIGEGSRRIEILPADSPPTGGGDA